MNDQICISQQEALQYCAARHARNEVANIMPELILGKKASQQKLEELTQALYMAHYFSFIEGNLANIDTLKEIEEDYN